MEASRETIFAEPKPIRFYVSIAIQSYELHAIYPQSLSNFIKPQLLLWSYSNHCNMRRTQRDLSGLTDWLTTYGVSLHAVEVQKTTFGSGIVAVRAIPDGDEPMIHVPANLVLSSNYVWKQAEKDPQLKEVLEALGEFAKVGIAVCRTVE